MYKYFFILSAMLIGCSDANFNVPDIADSATSDSAITTDSNSDTFQSSETCVKLTCGSNNCDKMPDGCGGEIDCTKPCSAGQACGGTAFDSSSSRNLMPKEDHLCSGTCVDVTSQFGTSLQDQEAGLKISCGSSSFRLVNCSNETKYISSTIKTCKQATFNTPSGMSYWCCPTSIIQ